MRLGLPTFAVGSEMGILTKIWQALFRVKQQSCWQACTKFCILVHILTMSFVVFSQDCLIALQMVFVSVDDLIDGR